MEYTEEVVILSIKKKGKNEIDKNLFRNDQKFFEKPTLS